MDPRNESVPEDLILQILARLPVKSLIRFKSVSRAFLRLPSDRHFVRLHHEISSRNPNLLIELLDSSGFITIDPSSLSVSRSSLDFLADRVRIRASSNGVLCCASVADRGLYYICNPNTRDFRPLPRARERPFTRFQPEYEATLVGLAFDPSTYEYNVVLAGFYRPFGRRPQDRLVCMVFDSAAGSWAKFVSSLCEEFTHMNRNQVVYSTGALHWLTHACMYLLVLDLRDLAWRKMSMPEEIAAAGGFAGRVYLLDFEGSVSVVRIYREWMSVWVLEDYRRELWVLKDRVNLRCIRGFATSAFPVSQSKDVVFLATQKKVLTYGRKDKVWREVYSVGDGCTYPLWFSAHSFTNTLFPCHQAEWSEVK
ncbi:F-box protein-like [Iris pallida]|uniref:F-box protein-like n=1 Tax=Iris pallida TaxID=29817 RepID=A0AAX6DGQ5_IRIPA|nr:F-box protein-like [Iris pallida]